MKRVNFVIAVVLLCFVVATAQNRTDEISIKVSAIETTDPVNPVPFAEKITATYLEKHLSVLASDEYEGRETGTEGQKKAARYIAKQFEEMGLPRIGEEDSYFQKISFIAENWQTIKFSVNEKRMRHLSDYYSFPSTNSNQELIEVQEVVFLGYGIDDENYNDYKGVDVTGKAILIYSGEPVGKGNISHITGTKELSDWSTDWRKKLKAAKLRGVSTVFILDHDIKKNINKNRSSLLSSQMKMGKSENAEENYANNVFISSTVAKEMVGDDYRKFIKLRDKIKKKGKPRNMVLSTNLNLIQKKRVRGLFGENVLGYIEGTDEELKDEVVIVTAHYDHLGKRGDSVYNGADDNASGTSTVMALAEAMAEAKEQGVGPRRSVLVMLVSGEEKGLLGSKYYTEFPIFDLDKTVANVNVDMVGRIDKKHKENPDYVYVIGSDRLSTELHEINESVNKQYTQLELDYTYNEEDDPNRYYYRSDHYNFALKNIPAVFYFNGTHEDYHRTSDTMDKIQFDKMAKIGQLVFYTTWELANRDKRIVVNVKP